MLQQRISIKDNNAEAALFRRRAMVAMAGVIVLTLMLLLNLYVVQVVTTMITRPAPTTTASRWCRLLRRVG